MRKHNPTLFIECLATEIVEIHVHIWRELAKNRKNNVYKNGDKLAIFQGF